MTSSLTILIAVISSGTISSMITIWVSRKKRKAETQSIELDNAQKVINIWKDLSDELNQQVKSLELKVDDLQNDIKVLEEKYKAQCDTCEYKLDYIKNNG